jgi:thiol-disulfide isomerase/thioredoxin
MKKNLICMLCIFVCLNAHARSHPAIGSKAPAFNFPKVLNASDREGFDLSSLRGKVVILEFWATWCGPCIQSIPHMNQIAGKLDPSKFQLIYVNKGQSEKKVRTFMNQHPMTGWSVLDGEKFVNHMYNVGDIPLSVIISSDGHIVGITHPNDVSMEQLQDVINGKSVQFQSIKY